MYSNKLLGKTGELRSCDYLIKEGYEILNKNFKCRYGEIDIIARIGNTISFIEVKTRSGYLYGQPEESINHYKINRIKSAASYYIQKEGLEECEIGFDIISIIANGSKFLIKHIINCF